MKSIGFLSLVAATCLAITPLVRGTSATVAHPERFNADVSVNANQPTDGGPGELFLSFSGPVQVPRKALPAGTYVFTKETSSFVTVRSADRKTVYTSFMTTPAMRKRNIDQVQVRVEREAPGAPLRILEVFAAGSSTGYEPIYPRRYRGE